MKYTYLYLTFCIGIFFSVISLAEKNTLLETLKKESDVNAIYNYINNLEWSAENLNILKALWEKDVNKYPDIPWNKLNNDITKLALANILMQSGRQCRVKIDIEELHDFVKSKTLSNDPRIKGKASYLLGLAGYDDDIPFLSTIVKNEQEGYAEEAALSLVFIHSKAALIELKSLHKKVKRTTLKSFLQNLVMKYHYITHTESRECNP